MGVPEVTETDAMTTPANITRPLTTDARIRNDCLVPAWVERLLVDGSEPSEPRVRRSMQLFGGCEVEFEEREGGSVKLVTVRVPGAVDLDPEAFERVTRETYRAVASAMGERHAVRFWNHIPHIHASMGPGLDRYMVFNAGRHASYADRFGVRRAAEFGPRVSTATGVGHRGSDLVVHCLGCTHPGRAVENPRQVPAYLYSSRYGPCPPCFARATIVNAPGFGRGMMLVGGTASVRGEGSVHEGDLDSQVGETLTNLASLVSGERGGADPLARFRELRVYCVHASHARRLRAILAARFGGVREIEFVRADICRKELLVEIEGVADIADLRAREEPS